VVVNKEPIMAAPEGFEEPKPERPKPRKPRPKKPKRRRKRKPRVFKDAEHLPLALTIPETAGVLHCTRQHVWAQVKAGKIKTTAPLGRVIRIPGPEVARILRGEATEAAAE
jgi:hypothetical protein